MPRELVGFLASDADDDAIDAFAAALLGDVPQRSDSAAGERIPELRAEDLADDELERE